MKKILIPLASVLAAFAAQAGVDFDFGADLRVRQEFFDNVPGLPGGGLLSTARSGKYTNRMRFRPRVWGEVRFDDRLRIYTRLADEFRWNVRPAVKSSRFPDEIFLDNLFIEGKGFFDGFLDFTVGRQDILGLYGLGDIFADATPNDGSRSMFADMVRFTLNVTDDSKLDLFGLYLHDDNHLRWGDSRSEHRSVTGLGGSGAEPERDEWGFGAVWSSDFGEALPYKLYAMHKNTAAYRRNERKIPSTRRETFGVNVSPQLTDEWSLQFDLAGQVGGNGAGKTLYGSSAYCGVKWKSASKNAVKPFASAGVRYMSGSKDTAETEGGSGAWDPMWARSGGYSEIFLYGTHYGTCWWSNLYYARLEAGFELGRRHDLRFTSGPMFAAVNDSLGGGDGHYKGYLNTLRYNFPLMLADKEKGERFEIFGHLHLELFNPGDYFETSRPAWFVRWQVEFKF